eukprot:4392933-Pyramimonas_sp.AAC.1
MGLVRKCAASYGCSCRRAPEKLNRAPYWSTGGGEGSLVSSEDAQGPQHRLQTANQGAHRTVRRRRPRAPTRIPNVNKGCCVIHRRNDQPRAITKAYGTYRGYTVRRTITVYQRRCRSRFPEASTLVRLDARSGTTGGGDLSVKSRRP